MERKRPPKQSETYSKFQIHYMKRGRLTPIDESFPFHDDNHDIHNDEKTRYMYFNPDIEEGDLQGMEDYPNALAVLASIVQANPTRLFCIVEVIHTLELNPWYGFVGIKDLPLDAGKHEIY